MASVDVLDGIMNWRNIGPFRGGRVVAVAGHPSDQNVFYFGACAGGVWKSTDGGTYWENVSDGDFTTASVGAIAVAESDPNVIYAGTGEACIRVDVTHGDGVYRSNDGGATWMNLGLKDTRHISRVRVHPSNPDIVYVAALGHAFGPNKERGVFRSQNGGANWERVLYKSDVAGAADLVIDPTNPRRLYATLWQGKRSFWDMSSGGPDSGVYRSDDGGDTWTDISDNPGLPEGLKGRMGVAASAAKSGRIWLLIEAEHGGLFRSDDGGDTFEKVNDSEEVRSRPWYYTHVFADPTDAETVWVLAMQSLKSTNGGRTFEKITTPHGDNHDLWIDSRNPLRMINGNDGGACVTYNGADTWSSIYNQPTSEIYHVATDDQFPYRVYGTQQDNSALSVPTRSFKGALLWEDTYTVGLSESGKIAVKPGDSNIVYSSYPGGTLQRYDHVTGQVRVIMPWPEYNQNTAPADFKYRFAWEFPIVISPHDPDTLYIGGNIVFRSRDEGTSWDPVSPDLTRDDQSKQQLSGPITSEGPWAEMYCTVYAFAESPHEQGVLWAGSDDGLVHLSRDGGGSWANVTPPGLPEWALVSSIEPSSHDPATTYVAATRYKLDDNRPFIFKTQDYGDTWTQITTGIPGDDFTRVVREDPERPGLLYAGTETGVYVSLDGGDQWDALRTNLPVVPIYDLQIKDGDLIAGTHGRSFWILDDLSPLRELTEAALSAPAHLVKPRNYTRLLRQAGSILDDTIGKQYMSDILGPPMTYRQVETPGGGRERIYLNAGTNPPDGVSVYYHLADEPEVEVAITLRAPSSAAIKTYSTELQGDGRLDAHQGMNRFQWDTRYPQGKELGDVAGGVSPFGAKNTGPLAPPGTYTIELTTGGNTSEALFEIAADPRSNVSQADLDAQFALQIAIRDLYSETHGQVVKIRNLRDQVQQWAARAEGHAAEARLTEAAGAIAGKLGDVENELVPFRSAGTQPRGIPLGLYAKLKELMGVVASADWAPTKSSRDVFASLNERLDSQADDLQRIVDEDVTGFKELIAEYEIPEILP